uniref:NADH-ubiquinone oxidoreductase chain 4L n=1 Tax=Monotoma quadricollis TaxID=346807 RepID=A0A343A3P3_9CUCU|nr:NADH dehydrogenase subunit 4L [Monotoma quadricollis]AOY39171.1 NADH dehydrogenase subunit 4L [Monotoma quadricollis]
MYLNMFMFFMGLLIYCLKRKHLLLMLMSLEFMVIILFLFMNFYFSMVLYEYYFLMLFLIITVCEGVLGLSLLVSMIRNFGNDHIMMFSLLW